MKYSDVLGQEATTAVLRQFVKEGKGFHHSYVFCGQHGSGKTTLGRILARALLCEAPVDGEPCDTCPSCSSLLEGGTHECFEELDAASKSKKEDLARIVEDIAYSTYSGRRRIYLFDESHRLSKAALDILLKPMEDSVSGSEDKKLVVIFCTTEPEKMTQTIFSRCAPAFVIRTVPAEVIAERLLSICEKEGIQADLEALVLIAELSECHIRTALKSVEGVSMTGPITVDSVFKFLSLGSNATILDMLLSLGHDLPKTIELSAVVANEISPSSVYERVAEALLSAYRLSLGVPLGSASQWDKSKLGELAKRGPSLLGLAARFASPPHKATKHMLVLDLGAAHHLLLAGTPPVEMCRTVVSYAAQEVPTAPPSAVKVEVAPAESKKHTAPATQKVEGTLSRDEKPHTTGGVWIDPRAIGHRPAGSTTSTQSTSSLSVELFRQLVNHHIRGLKRDHQGRTG